MHLSRFPSLWQPLQFIRTTVRWRMDSPASLQAQLVSLGNPWDRGTVLASASMQQEGTDEYKASVDTEHKQPPLPPAVPHNLFTRRYQPPLITQAMGQACFRVGQLMAEQADTRGVSGRHINPLDSTSFDFSVRACLRPVLQRHRQATALSIRTMSIWALLLHCKQSASGAHIVLFSSPPGGHSVAAYWCTITTLCALAHVYQKPCGFKGMRLDCCAPAGERTHS